MKRPMPHPRYDWLMEFSEALDEHRLLRQPYDALEEESHDDLVTAFCATLPAPPPDPGVTTANEEIELAAAYAGWLADRGNLVVHPILTPEAVAHRTWAKVQQR
jgi:hypothetical protein